jgi:hypothetical protein
VYESSSGERTATEKTDGVDVCVDGADLHRRVTSRNGLAGWLVGFLIEGEEEERHFSLRLKLLSAQLWLVPLFYFLTRGDRERSPMAGALSACAGQKDEETSNWSSSSMND